MPIRVVSFDNDKEMPSCIICLVDFEAREKIYKIECEWGRHHIFHQDCLDDWVRKDGKSCPLCGTVLPVCIRNKVKSNIFGITSAFVILGIVLGVFFERISFPLFLAGGVSTVVGSGVTLATVFFLNFEERVLQIKEE